MNTETYDETIVKAYLNEFIQLRGVLFGPYKMLPDVALYAIEERLDTVETILRNEHRVNPYERLNITE